MKYLGYIGYFLGMAWGTLLVVGAAHGPWIEYAGEGVYLLVAAIWPLALIGIVHTAVDRRTVTLPAVYATGVALIFAGELIAYRILFLSNGPKLMPSLESILVLFLVAFVWFSAIPITRATLTRVHNARASKE